MTSGPSQPPLGGADCVFLMPSDVRVWRSGEALTCWSGVVWMSAYGAECEPVMRAAIRQRRVKAACGLLVYGFLSLPGMSYVHRGDA